MEIFIKVCQVIVCFSLLVLVHEFGHFLFAKIFHARVDKFYLFFYFNCNLFIKIFIINFKFFSFYRAVFCKFFIINREAKKSE